MKKAILLVAAVLMLSFIPNVHAFVKTQGHVCDVDFVAEKAGDPNWVILDARGKAEYEDGHIPGAVNRFYFDNLDDDGCFFKPAGELRAEFAALLGARQPAQVVWASRATWGSPGLRRQPAQVRPQR